jgi:hypothetical protein
MAYRKAASLIVGWYYRMIVEGIQGGLRSDAPALPKKIGV